MNYAELLSDDSHDNTIAAKPWLALIALVCGMISVVAIMDEAIPMLFMTIGAIALSLSGMIIGGMSIRRQLFEKTASMGVFISLTSLIALAGSHLQ